MTGMMFFIKTVFLRWVYLSIFFVSFLTAGAFADDTPRLAGGYVDSGVSKNMKEFLGHSAPRVLDLPPGQSVVVQLPSDARDIIISDPEKVSAVLQNPRQVLLIGGDPGLTNAFFFGAGGREILSLEIRVERDLGGLEEAILRLAPGARVQAESVDDRVILSGMVPNNATADRVFNLTKTWIGADNDKVLNLVSIEGKDQVLLKVRVVEMERSVIKQLGINLDALASFGRFVGRVVTANPFNIAGSSLGGLNSTLTWTSGQDRVGGTLRALERVGVTRTLAEPTLTAISGESAKFLAGGEFPVPRGRSVNSDTGQVTVDVEYKPFGVGLGFTPVVLSEGRISLRVSTEVSELTSEGALTLSGGSTIIDGQLVTIDSLTLPGLRVRKADTTVEMPSGSSLVIAGLIKDENKQSLNSVPGIKNLPFLGALFRSRDFLNNQTELVIIVTPYLVDPVNPHVLKEPGEGIVTPSDASTVLMGRLTEVYRAPGAQTKGRALVGPHGFVVK